MKRCATLLVLLSFVCSVSELSATVTTRHYNFEEGAAGAEATELIDITDEPLHENGDDFFGWGSHIWIEVSGVEARPLPAGGLDEVVEDAALVAPSLELTDGQGLYADVSDGSAFDSPAIGSKLAIQFDGKTRYDDFLTASGSRGVYLDPAALEAGDEVTANVNVSESFNLMTQAWVYPLENNGEKQTVWQVGREQGSVNITEDGFWQFEDLGSVGVLNCKDDGLEVPYSCEEGDLEFPVAFNEWTHLGIYRGGNGAEVYLNGELVAGNINPSPANFFGSFANLITIGGRDDGTNGFIGLIDDFKVQGEVSLGAHDMDINLLPSLVGDFNLNGELDGGDIDLLSKEVASANPNLSFDLNSDGAVNATDRSVWVKELKMTWVGDANLDGEFNSTDFVAVFSAAKYEDGIAGNATWAEGDWNGDMDFDSGDFVAAFTDGGYEKGALPPQAAAVPEPTTFVSLAGACLMLWFARRR
ncbi:MAG: PEP-CTERM sorting domain-containing protein [Planctomycetales bacterium]|nr:PEP-CTERM sorting domain-containing protein [Planctomycetales bacterium]